MFRHLFGIDETAQAAMSWHRWRGYRQYADDYLTRGGDIYGSGQAGL